MQRTRQLPIVFGRTKYRVYLLSHAQVLVGGQ